MNFNKFFDHTILKADATKEDVEKVCNEATLNKFASVCVNEYYTAFVKERLEGSGVLTCVVVGFPIGAVDTKIKVMETQSAIEKGADEIDMVINVGALKDGEYDYVQSEIEQIKKACGEKTLKVIIETCLLTDEEKVKACELAVLAGADFVKTSTGFSKAGATIRDVAIMRKSVGDKAKVKASGGIRDYNTAQAMIDAGADRLGTSATLNILKQRQGN